METECTQSTKRSGSADKGHLSEEGLGIANQTEQ